MYVYIVVEHVDYLISSSPTPVIADLMRNTSTETLLHSDRSIVGEPHIVNATFFALQPRDKTALVAPTRGIRFPSSQSPFRSVRGLSTVTFTSALNSNNTGPLLHNIRPLSSITACRKRKPHLKPRRPPRLPARTRSVRCQSLFGASAQHYRGEYWRMEGPVGQ